MKNLLLATVFTAIAVCLAAQNTVNFSLSEGQYTVAQKVVSLSNGNFLVIGIGQESPAYIAKKQLFLAVFNAQRELLFQQKFKTPKSTERYEIRDVVALPDGKFAISIEGLLCDVVDGNVSLQVFGSNGFQTWGQSNLDDLLRGEPNFKQLPDGNFLVVGGRKTLLLHGGNGNQLALNDLSDLTDPQNIDRAFFEPSTLDFLAIGSPQLQFWKNTAPIGAVPIYKLVKTSSSISGSYRKILPLGDGRFLASFTASPNIEGFEIIDKNLNKEPFNFPKKGCTDFQATKNEIYFLGTDAATGKAWLVKTDFSGNILKVYSILDARFGGSSLALSNQGIVVAGQVKTGQKDGASSNIWQGRQAWVAFQNYQDTLFEFGKTDVKIVEVIQKQPVKVEKTAETFFPFTPYFNIAGGKFKIKIENKGTEPLEQIELNIQHDRTYSSTICGPHIPAKRVVFTNPNTEIALDFGDISAVLQANQPQKFCFFLTSPNRQPDAFPADDVFCHEFKFTVPADEPSENLSGAKISPNPTTGIFQIQLPAGSLPATATLTDFLGKQIQDFGKIEEQERQFSLPDELPAGIYFLKIETEKGAVLIRKICFSKN